MRDGVAETLAYTGFPPEHWRRIRTNNGIERINREIRRRTRVVGTFPDGNSALMLVTARLKYIAENEWGGEEVPGHDEAGGEERAGKGRGANGRGVRPVGGGAAAAQVNLRKNLDGTELSGKQSFFDIDLTRWFLSQIPIQPGHR